MMFVFSVAHAKDIFENPFSKYVASVDKSKYITIENSKIDGFLSKKGVFARPVDLFEGFENFNGINVNFRNTTLKASEAKSIDLDTIFLNDGTTIDLDELFRKLQSGGDMGGG